MPVLHPLRVLDGRLTGGCFGNPCARGQQFQTPICILHNVLTASSADNKMHRYIVGWTLAITFE